MRGLFRTQFDWGCFAKKPDLLRVAADTDRNSDLFNDALSGVLLRANQELGLSGK